jgi:hypothetical protein
MHGVCRRVRRRVRPHTPSPSPFPILWLLHVGSLGVQPRSHTAYAVVSQSPAHTTPPSPNVLNKIPGLSKLCCPRRPRPIIIQVSHPFQDRESCPIKLENVLSAERGLHLTITSGYDPLPSQYTDRSGSAPRRFRRCLARSRGHHLWMTNQKARGAWADKYHPLECE